LTSLNDEQPERLLLHLHTGLPLLPAADDGSRSAVLARFGAYEVGLTEFPPDHMPILPLWVELFGCHSGRKLLDGRGFSEIADAVDAVRELIGEASAGTQKSWAHHATPETRLAGYPD
jgi:hypothetical protein